MCGFSEGGDFMNLIRYERVIVLIVLVVLLCITIGTITSSIEKISRCVNFIEYTSEPLGEGTHLKIQFK